MDVRERVREKAGRVAELHPDQRERVEACARVIEERGTEQLFVAFEKALDRMLAARSREAAVKVVDRMEHTLFESTLVSPFLGARESKGTQRIWIGVGVGVLLALATAGAFLGELLRLL